jgi:NADH dehydrogenase
MPDNENRLTLLTKWLWQIATRQHASLLITGHPDQHLGVEVGLERAERTGTLAAEPETEAKTTSAGAEPPAKGGAQSSEATGQQGSH